MPGPAATVGSMHICPMCNPGTPPPPHVGGPVSGPGIPTVLIGGKPAAVMGDMCICAGPPDTIVQGEATVLIGGKPAATIGSMTAHGGSVTVGNPTVLIGTGGSGATAVMAVHKIPFPKISPILKTMASITGRGKQLNNAIAQQQAVRDTAPVEEVLEDSTTVTLTTTFAKDQLLFLCQHQPKALFMGLFIKTFGTDIPTVAFEELYNDILNDAPILEAPLTVKVEIPFGGRQAAFYSNHQEGIHEIFVAEQVIRNAVLEDEEHNELRGELMTMLIEEYGHYLDYLLRHKYALTENKDAQHDEGAKFAYQLFSINPIEQADQLFAEATIDGGNPTNLIWDFTTFHNDLKQYVNEDRQNQDDNQGNYEFYKAGFANPGHGEYGHGDIEEEALIEDLERYLSYSYDDDEIDAKIQEVLDKIYLGNWLRDFSQAVDPMIIRPMAKGMEVTASVSDDLFDKNGSVTEALKKEDFSTDVAENQNVTITYPTLPSITSWKDLPKFGKINEYVATTEFKPVKVSADFVATAIEMLAAREFIRDADGKKREFDIKNESFTGFLEAFRKQFKEIDIETLGAYRPEEHIDNPLGLGQNEDGSDRGDDVLFSKFIGKVSDTSPMHKIGLGTAASKGFGMKNYIRGAKTAFSTGCGQEAPTSYEYIRSQLKKAAKGGFNDTESLVHLGAGLHTLEDYFAHTNFAELSLIKLGYTAVFPWVDKVPETKFKYEYAKVLAGTQNYDPYLLFPKNELKNIKDRNSLLSACIPLVTGTFGMVDTAASVLPLINHHLFSMEIEPWEKAECKRYTFADVMIREMAKDMDDNLSQTDSMVNFENAVNALLKIRDFKLCTSMVPDFVDKGLHYISEFIKLKQNFTKYFVGNAIISAINDAQTALNKDLKIMAAGSFAIGTNPSHTQIAKDDTHHPMHKLSSELAVYAVKHIGGAIFETWGKNGKNPKKALDLLDICMRHPSVSDWQDEIVEKWAKDNKAKICEASSPSIIIERVFHSIEHFEEGLESVNGFIADSNIIEQLAEFYKKQSGKTFDVNGMQNDLQKGMDACDTLEANAKTARAKWNTKYPKPAYCVALLKTQRHTIGLGDTLSGLAQKYETSERTIKNLNPVTIQGDVVQLGSIIKVPKHDKDDHKHE